MWKKESNLEEKAERVIEKGSINNYLVSAGEKTLKYARTKAEIEIKNNLAEYNKKNKDNTG